MSDFSSLLFIPFNKTKYFYNGLVSNADAIIVDFEDSVEYKSNDISITEIKKALSHINPMVIANPEAISTDSLAIPL